VLDARLNVRGVEGLGVVDASAMPNLISANPNVPAIVMALKAAAMWTGAAT
jgi:choline dehydrogenase-like flavoprotein